MWFDNEDQEIKLLGFLQKGKALKQASKTGSAFNDVILWIASAFKVLVNAFNKAFKGLFIAESGDLIEQWRKDYSIPNDVFYLSDEENRTDVFVLKYLMKGNADWNFRAIANIYGIDIAIHNAFEYYRDSRIPNKIPHILRRSVTSTVDTMVIVLSNDRGERIPYKIPHVLTGNARKINKIKNIYAIIKQAQCRILYESAEHGAELETRIVFKKGVGL